MGALVRRRRDTHASEIVPSAGALLEFVGGVVVRKMFHDGTTPKSQDDSFLKDLMDFQAKA